jgi:hypothetical protein
MGIQRLHKPQRLAPPPDMPLEQAKIWNRIVASFPAGFFTADNEFALRALVVGAVSEDTDEQQP